MATARAAYAAEKIIGHGDENIKQDVSDYKGAGEGEPNETMKALVWQGKKKVEIRRFSYVPSMYYERLLTGDSSLQSTSQSPRY
jgi:hypothetical protein